jgi:hypothetical protein
MVTMVTTVTTTAQTCKPRAYYDRRYKARYKAGMTIWQPKWRCWQCPGFDLVKPAVS